MRFALDEDSVLQVVMILVEVMRRSCDESARVRYFETVEIKFLAFKTEVSLGFLATLQMILFFYGQKEKISAVMMVQTLSNGFVSHGEFVCYAHTCVWRSLNFFRNFGWRRNFGWIGSQPIRIAHSVQAVACHSSRRFDWWMAVSK